MMYVAKYSVSHIDDLFAVVIDSLKFKKLNCAIEFRFNHGQSSLSRVAAVIP